MSARKRALLGIAITLGIALLVSIVAAYQTRSRSLQAEQLLARGEELAGQYYTAMPSGDGSFDPAEAKLGGRTVADLVDNSIAGAEFEAVVEDLYRMADMNLLDLNDDEIVDFVVSGFGAVFGSVAWYESQPDGSYEERTLVAVPVAVKTEPFDFNGDGLIDIMALLSDAREGLHILENQGNNQFETHTIFETHPAYGHTYFEFQEFNADGAMDVLVVNGDNVDSDPYNTNKNYQGLRIFLNRGDYAFEEAYFYPMYGAFSFVPFTNGQVMNGRWMTMDTGDVDGDGDIDVVLGGGNVPTGMPAHMDLYTELARNAPPAPILKNSLRGSAARRSERRNAGRAPFAKDRAPETE